MQQTETYKLNIIEDDDKFSPDALNKNAEALEAQLARIDAALLKFACGTYTGNGSSSRTISLPFTPKVLYVGNTYGSTYYNSCTCGGLALENKPVATSSATLVTIVAGGFRVCHSSATQTTNKSDGEYRYFAIG